MNANAKKWVEALRSGKYEQGKYDLRYDNKFCVLGVACDLMVKEELIKERYMGWGAYEYGGQSRILCKSAAQWLGLCSLIGSYGGCSSDLMNSLSWDNDRGLSFSQLADLIESEPEGLFNKEEL